MNTAMLSSADREVRELIQRAERLQTRPVYHEQISFFASLANHRFLSAVTNLALSRNAERSQFEAALANSQCRMSQALADFTRAMELGYVANAAELSMYFYSALVANDLPTAHFLSAVPPDARWLDGEFKQWQVFFGFAILRGEEERTKLVLDYLQGICFDGEAGEDHGPFGELQRTTWHAFDAIYRRNTAAVMTHLKQRVDLWPRALTEEQRNDCLYLYDLTTLGFIRLAQMRGMMVNISHPDLPLALLDAPKD